MSHSQERRATAHRTAGTRRAARFVLPLSAALTALVWLGSSIPAHAQLPTASTVIHGTATVGTAGNQMMVTNSPNAILNWQSFSIGANHGVRFQQESAASKVLNRVTGSDPSRILGSLTSNGQVWLINPHGVLFGQNARINVAGLVASTLNISNTDFLANRFNFANAGGPGRGEVMNQGEIRTSFGGRVWMLGEQVRNGGLIESPGGTIVLAAGKSIELIDSGMPNVIVRVTAPDNEAVNLGTLVAAGGSVDLHGGIVNQDSIIRADSVGTDDAGRITLRAQGDLKLGDSSRTSASAAGTGAGGSVLAQSSGGTTLVSGQVSTTSVEGQGGRIHLLGEIVEVFRQASVDASGASGGGEVLAGGDYQGKNPDIRNATTTYFGGDATLKANATKAGDGGRVIVWGNETTKAHGRVEAKGGPLGGNGGLIETSGKSLDFAGARVSASAAHGSPGLWLLDPTDIVIDPVFAAAISSTLSGGTDVAVDTSGAGPDVGDLNVAAGTVIDHSGTAAVKLTLAANRDIWIDSGARIMATGAGSLALDLNAGLTPVTGSGGIYIDRATLNTKGGELRMYGQSDPANGFARARGVCNDGGCLPITGIAMAGTSINTGDGNISIRGASAYAEGVLISASAIESAGGTISLDGTSSNGGGPAVSIVGGTIISVDGNVNIVGDATSATDPDMKPHGIEIADTGISGGVGVDLRGDSHFDDGVRLTNSTIDSTGGKVKIVGTSFEANGLLVYDATQISAATSIELTGDTASDSEAGLALDDIVLGGPSQSGDIILRARNGGVVADSIRLHAPGIAPTTTIQTSGSLVFVPGGGGDPDTVPINVGTTSGKGFELDPADLSTINPATGWVIIGGNSHTGRITTASGGLTLPFSLTLQNEGAGSEGIGFAGIDVSGKTLTLATAGPLVQEFGGEITADALLVRAGPSSELSLTKYDNRINRLAVDLPASFSLFNAGPLVIGAVSGNGFSTTTGTVQVLTVPNSSSVGDFFVRTSPGSSLTLAQNVSTLNPGSNITLVAGSYFVNAGGSLTPGAGGRWLVHAAEAAPSSLNGLPYDFVQFNAPYDSAVPAQANNGVLYAEPLDLHGKLARAYDGTVLAVLDGSTTFTGAPTGYSVSVVDSGNGVFLDKNAGNNKPIDLTSGSAPGLNMTDPLGKPVFGQDSSIIDYVGDINKAKLTYVADPAAREAGVAVTGLTGSLAGFVPGDTASDSTSGLLAWVTPATAASPAGSYAVEGNGLTAINYDFVQSPGNATALTLLAPNRPIQPVQDFPRQPPEQEIEDPLNVLIAANPPGAGEVIDATSAAASLFGPLDLSLMSRDEMQRVLDSRREFKKKLFADAIFKLEEDPSLADVRPCASAAEASSGMCMLTEEQRAGMARRALGRHMHRTKIAKLPQIERKIAVLFGLNQYADTRIPPLVDAVPDAEAVGELLANTLGYEVSVIKDATKADIVRTLNQLSTEVGPRDSVVIYYAGHGYQLESKGAGFWLGTDASPADPRGWISNTDVSKMLSGIKVSQLVLISDSCYSGAFTREQQMTIAARVLNPAEVLTKRSVVVMSSGGDEPVADEGKDGHSIFAWYLMQNIRQVDNWRPGTTVFEQVRRDVVESFPQTPQYGAAASAGHQGGDYLFEFRQLEDVP